MTWWTSFMRAPVNIEGLYVHVPFCDGKCAYCAFYSVPYSADRADRWLRAVAAEARQLSQQYGRMAPETLYFGGGTPTILSPAQARQLVEVIREELLVPGWSARTAAEWTVEANPVGLTADVLMQWRGMGVTRVSLGVQSLRDDVLMLLGRRHTAADVEDSVGAIRAAGFSNWSVDLIACVPGVSRESWRQMLCRVVEWEPKHVSVYALTAEEGSALLEAVHRGDLALPGDEEQLGMLSSAGDVLAASGYLRYEISNYALPGHACLHNLSCWRGRNYLGLGCAASSRVGRRRWTNPARLDPYVKAWLAGMPPDREEDLLDSTLDASERLVFGLRMAEGVDLEGVIRDSGCDAALRHRWLDTLARLAREGLTEHREGYWRLTRRGRDLADHVAVELMP